MNISKQNIDEVNAEITISIEKDDYAPRVDNVLKDYRKKANIPGFRPGKVPVSLIRKMYGQSVTLDEVNKLMGEELSKFLQESDFDVLGEPLPSANQAPVDLDSNDSFEFKFDVAITPEFEISLSKREKIKNYVIKVEDEMVERQLNGYADRFGQQVDTDVVEEKDMTKGMFVELDEKGEIKEGGIFVENVVVSPERIQLEDVKAEFIGAQKEKVIRFNPLKAFENATEVSSLLNIEKEVAENLTSDFNFTIKEITRFQKAEVNQELFDKVYGEGTVKTLEEFNAKIEEEVKGNFEQDSQYRFLIDAREKLVNKIDKVVMPEEFLKRWLLAKNQENENFTEEQLEKEFPQVIENLKWDLIKGKLAKENEIKTEQEDVMNYAKKMAKMQFMQYGMTNIPEEHLENYAQEILKNEEQGRNVYEKAFEEKVVAYIREHVKVEDHEISLEDFNKLFDKK